MKASLHFRPSIHTPSGTWAHLEGEFNEATGCLWHDTAIHKQPSCEGGVGRWAGKFGIHLATRTIITVLEEAPAAVKPASKAKAA